MVQTHLETLPHGITLSVRSTGERGRPVLMFLHGFPEAAFVWDALLEHFAKPENGAYRCVAPNLRGFERSSTPTEVSAYRPKHLVQDVAALIALECGPSRPQEAAKVGDRGGNTAGQLECLVAHDWGGAVAWNLANQRPDLAKKLAIVNSPHPGTFWRELCSNPEQQAASAYMNFLIRPDAERLLAENGYERLWAFFTSTFADAAQPGWLTDAEKDRYRAVWNGPPGAPPGSGLTGGCNYYRASPLRPPTPEDAGVTLPREMLTVKLPTLVVWAMEDRALPPELIDGLDAYIPDLTLHRVEQATHWIVHEQPALVASLVQSFLKH
jgi:epoxide hydrolase 4